MCAEEVNEEVEGRSWIWDLLARNARLIVGFEGWVGFCRVYVVCEYSSVLR